MLFEHTLLLRGELARSAAGQLTAPDFVLRIGAIEKAVGENMAAIAALDAAVIEATPV